MTERFYGKVIIYESRLEDSRPRGSPACQEAGRAQVSAAAAATEGWSQMGAGLGFEVAGSPGPGLLPGP